MLLSLSSLASPDLDLPGLIRLAVQHRLALELHASRDARVAVATNLFFSDPAKVGAVLADAGVALAAVWMTVPIAPSAVVMSELARAADDAASAGCGVVRLVESQPTPPATLRAAADRAVGTGVRFAIGNPPGHNGLTTAWHRVDAAAHPLVGCSLDTGDAAASGAPPSVAIPTLGGRIAHVRLRHPPTDAETVHRLAGVGYDGPLSIGGPATADAVRSWLPQARVGRVAHT